MSYKTSTLLEFTIFPIYRAAFGLISDDPLVDEKVSKSTLSRLENGQTIGSDKMDLILGKLEIQDIDIPKYFEDFKIQDEIGQHMFRSIEARIRKGVLSLTELNQELESIELPALRSYLRAKRFFVKKKYKRAIEHYELTINAKDNEYCPYSNVKATSYLDLSVIAYKNNNYQEALLYVDLGLQIFNDQGLKQHVKYSLIYNKAFIFELIGMVQEAEKILEPAWQARDDIGDIRTQIQVYQLKSNLYQHKKDYFKAYDLLSIAFEIANNNALADQSYYILVDLGKITYELGRYHHSVRCLLSALKFEPRLQIATPIKAYIELSQTYIALGNLKKAKEQILLSIKIAKKTKNIHKLIRAYIVHANIYIKQNKRDAACFHYKKALRLAEEYNFEQYQPELHEYLSNCN